MKQGKIENPCFYFLIFGGLGGVLAGEFLPVLLLTSHNAKSGSLKKRIAKPFGGGMFTFQNSTPNGKTVLSVPPTHH